MNKFGELIRSKREENDMYLRHLAAMLDMDTGQLSKIERGERTAREDQIKSFASSLKIDEHTLYLFWKADQVESLIHGDPQAIEILEIVKNNVKHN